MKFTRLLLCLPWSTLLSPLAAAPPAPPAEITVATYNVENYVSAKPKEAGEARSTPPKSEKEMQAVVRVIKDLNPDILGVCEMGSPERFEDFKSRLKAAGLGYVDFEYVQAADQDRHLALVSRFPIVARHPQTDVSYEIDGQPEKVRRGFLDVTIAVNPTYQLRMVGVHLKSKLPVPEGEAIVRRHEAQLLRKHLESIMIADPEVNLLCYGDFNDTKNEPMFEEITGAKASPMHLADLWAKDELGDRWTHYWRTADLYSRIDYLFASPALVREVVLNKSRVYRSADWNEASDHRPVLAAIFPINKK